MLIEISEGRLAIGYRYERGADHEMHDIARARGSQGSQGCRRLGLYFDFFRVARVAMESSLGLGFCGGSL